jgi:general secretion pathway protein C
MQMNGQISQQFARRLPEFLSLLLFMLLCACTAYWTMQLVKPPIRALAAPPQAQHAQIDVRLAAGLFGGRGTVAVASNYQLLGVVAAKNAEESVAILSADGKPAQALRQGKELLPGTSIKEVHATYVLLSEGGILKRVMLPENVAPKPGLSTASPGSASAPATSSQDVPAYPPTPGAADT